MKWVILQYMIPSLIPRLGSGYEARMEIEISC